MDGTGTKTVKNVVDSFAAPFNEVLSIFKAYPKVFTIVPDAESGYLIVGDLDLLKQLLESQG